MQKPANRNALNRYPIHLARVLQQGNEQADENRQHQTGEREEPTNLALSTGMASIVAPHARRDQEGDDG